MLPRVRVETRTRGSLVARVRLTPLPRQTIVVTGATSAIGLATEHEVPPAVPWTVRIDGHAGDRPVKADAPFASNWQLPAARASTVVGFLNGAGVPADRVVVAAFGETRPLAPARTRSRVAATDASKPVP